MLRRLEDAKDDKLRPGDKPSFILHSQSELADNLVEVLRSRC